MASGYVRLYRSLWDNPAFNDWTEAAAFSRLFSLAVWKTKTLRYKGRFFTLERGQLALSLRDMARLLNWSEPKCRRYLTRLTHEGMVDASTDAGVNVITICNYDVYQPQGDDTDAPSGTVPTHQPTQDRRRTDAQTKERKEGKEKKEDIYPPIIPPLKTDTTKKNGAVFEAWYSGYPRKVGKGVAKKVFDRIIARGDATPSELEEGLKRYIRTKPPTQAWCHPSTWLNGQRWLDQENLGVEDDGNPGPSLFEYDYKGVEY